VINCIPRPCYSRANTAPCEEEEEEEEEEVANGGAEPLWTFFLSVFETRILQP